MIAVLYRDAEGIPAISRWSSEATPPDRNHPCSSSKGRIPEGCQPDRRSVQIPIFVFYPCLLQKLDQFFAKRLHTMMLGLIRDVFLHLRSRSRTHRECSVALLPGELSHADFLMHPDRRCFLQLPHEIRQTMRRLQSHQQMHMIGYSADTLRKPATVPPRYSCNRSRQDGSMNGIRSLVEKTMWKCRARNVEAMAMRCCWHPSGMRGVRASYPVVSLRSTTG